MQKPYLAVMATLGLLGCSAEEATTNIKSATSRVGDAVTGLVGEGCSTSKPRDELSYSDAKGVYDCLSADMVAGYQNGDKRWIPAEFVNDYRGWTPASSLPADPGVHGERYLLTYVNAVGSSEYLKFAEEGAKMPAGTVIANESFSINGEGKASAGPLYLMQKVEEGVSPNTNDWYYMMVAPGGAPQAVNVVESCHSCHMGFEDRDSLGYPVPEVRAGS